MTSILGRRTKWTGEIFRELWMKKTKRSGFTIVEMLTVVAVISILVTLVTKASVSSIKNSREKRSKVMAAAIEMGIATFHQQKGKWPKAIEDYAESGEKPKAAAWTFHSDACDKRAEAGADGLSANEVDSVIREVVEESGKGNPLFDVSGLVVTRASNAPTTWHGNNYGDSKHVASYTFAEARHRGIDVSNMAFGYQRRRDGSFRRFRIFYSPDTDSVKVERWHLDGAAMNGKNIGSEQEANR